MIKKKLELSGQRYVRIAFEMDLDVVDISIEVKSPTSLMWSRKFTKTFTNITKETKIEDYILETFSEYAKRLDIENYWENYFGDAEVIELPILEIISDIEESSIDPDPPEYS